jgi:DNA-binding NtrC family response regulator
MGQLQDEAREKSPSDPGKPARRVLVVDDEPLARWSIGEVLGERGYRVTAAADAVSAFRALAATDGPPDLVLLDLRLPDSTDLAALSIMHRLFPKLPIVLMTAHGGPELFGEARRRGAAAVMSKPFEIDALGPMVEHVLANH